jgi:hypothetical protein
MVTLDYIDLFRRLDEMGLTDALLPFLFIFVIIFAVLEKSHIFAKRKADGTPDETTTGTGRKFNAVIAFVVAMFVVVPHIMGTYPDGYDVIEIMKSFLPGMSAVLIAALMMLILIGLFGGSSGTNKSAFGGWIASAAFIIVVIVFGASAGWWGGWDWLVNFLGEDALSLVIMLLIFGLIVAYIMGPSEKEGFFSKRMNEAGGWFWKPGP